MQDQKSFLRSLLIRTVVALSVLALVAIAGFVLLQSMLWSQESSGRVINVAGKQRMLSQRAPRLLLESLAAPDEEARRLRLEELSATLDDMERDHRALVHGDPARGLPGEPPEAVRALYHEQGHLDERMLGYLQALRELEEIPAQELAHHPLLHSSLEQSRGELLADLNHAVRLYEEDASVAVSRLNLAQGGLVLVMLLVLLLEAVFIFRPMLGMLRSQLQTLEEQRRQVQLVLDNTGDALWLVDAQGGLLPLRSAAARRWFGDFTPGAPLWEHLFAQEPQRAQMLQLGLEELQEDIMPPEVVMEQLPGTAHHQDKQLALRYIPLESGAPEEGALLVVARDITEQLEHERKESHNRSMQSFVRYLLHDRASVTAAVREMERLLTSLGGAMSEEVFRRTLHTIKGNAAIYGLEVIAQRAHELEDTLALEPDTLSPLACQQELEPLWRQLLQETEVFLESEHSGITLQTSEYQSFLGMVEHAQDRSLLQVVRSWQYPQLEMPLQNLSRQAERLARQLEREVKVQIDAYGLRANLEGMEGFWSSLVHVLRNALDHGLEDAQERQSQGKPQEGNLWLTAHMRGHGLEISIHDDGRGIDWDKVRQRAQERGLPHQSQQDLVDALLADGLSTRQEITSLSGRGVGMAAVLQEVQRLHGSVEVESSQGQGTTWSFFFPQRRVHSPLFVSPQGAQPMQ